MFEVFRFSHLYLLRNIIFFACVGGTWKESCVHERGEKHFIDLSKCPTEKRDEKQQHHLQTAVALQRGKSNESEKFNWLNWRGFNLNLTDES